ncbi:MAG TPA: hypothetical protein DCR14_04355 [Acidimicrobiaceae bacterium]|nr:hypothetical protein [Acidimicrobiaceae bacterium]
MRRPDELTRAFRAQGLKITPQRQLLFTLLHDNETHPTAEALYTVAHAQMPGISRRTVYQTLTDLVSMGELSSLAVGGGATRFDPNTAAHHHALCDECGALLDIYVDDLQFRAQGLEGFAASGATIVFNGRCATCVPNDLPNNPVINNKEHQQ